ncbi:MAG: S1C family serine protease [Chthoniobacterales bacterium]
MKTTTYLAVAAAVGLLPTLGFAQTPPAPPAPAAPAAPGVAPVPPVPPVAPVPPVPRERRERDRGPKVPVTYLGVETSELPSVVADQLGLAKGFGLVVDYVVPDGPAAAAGVQQNDILKMLNDQILLDPDQLSKLVRSMPEGASVTLTVLRKGAETKLTAKLAKREVPQRRGLWPQDFEKHMRGHDFGQLGEAMKDLHVNLGDIDLNGTLGDVGENVREEVRNAQREAQQAARAAAREGRETAREAAREAREAARQIRVTRQESGGMRTTQIDMNKAEIVYHDTAGELKIGNVAGRRVLTAKNPEGGTVFSGPIETKEEIDKLPAEVRQRYDQLEQKDLPALPPPNVSSREDNTAEGEADGDNDDDADEDGGAVLEVSAAKLPGTRFRRLDVNTILI